MSYRLTSTLQTFLLVVVIFWCGRDLNSYVYQPKSIEQNPFFQLHTYHQYPHQVSKDSSLWLELIELGVPPADIHQLVKAARPVFNLSKVNPSMPFRLQYRDGEEEGALELLEFRLSRQRLLKLTKVSDASWEVEERKLEEEVELVSFQGEVSDSLWNSGQRAEMPPQLIVELAEIFAWQVDFSREVRPGDRWRLTVERKKVRGQWSGWGSILVAEYLNTDESLKAVHYQREGEFLGYFNPEGESLEKMFLKSPIKFGRISSRFSRRRFHPVRKVYRPHRGVDYAAPIGTPIRAVGDGRVTIIGRRGGAGKMIRIRHNEIYQTVYMHMSRFAKKLRKGSKVKQGQVIGYVGKTGLATGPHLHYEFYDRGRFVDPLKVKFPSAKPVADQHMTDFLQLVSEQLTKLPDWEAELMTASRGLSSEKNDP